MRKLFTLLASILVYTAINAQSTAINLKNIAHNGVTDTVDNAPIVVDDTLKKVTVSGNKKITGSQYDASTAQHISTGIMTWTQSFNLSTQKSWVTASITDGSGNVYITGGVATGTTNGVDLFVRKYTSGGSPVWTYTYNGPNSTTDVGTGLAIDGSNNIYVCGASDGTAQCLVDFVTIKLKGSSGTTLWTPAASRYNYNNSYDAATSISYNSVTALVQVTGPSGTTYTDWDIATVSYKASTGATYSVSRVANPGGHEDKSFGLATDTLGNAYTVGTTWNGTNGSYDISLQKIDTAMNMVWIKSVDGGYNLDDAAYSLSLDDSLNIYVVGSGYYQDTTLSNLILVKFDKNGNEKWKKLKRPPANGSSAQGVCVKVKNTNEIFVGGNFTSNNNQDIGFLRYDRSGDQTMEKYHNGSANGEDKCLDLALGDSNYVYVSGRVYASGILDSNIVLTYQYKDFPTVITGTPSYVNNELIVGFHPNVLKMTAINNREKTYGNLNDFVADSTCNKINTALGGSWVYCQAWPTRKIFDLTAADTLSQTRLGDYIRVPKFYCSLLLSIDASTFTLSTTRNKIKQIRPDVYFSDLNLMVSVTGTNDSLYPIQHALHTTTLYPHANINADSAWAITTGQPNVKVGIYDTGVDFGNRDFHGISKGGYNYVNNAPIDTTNYIDNSNHGTGVAGIIGARRNNNKGIAGLAGGSADSGKVGVSVYDMRVVGAPTSTIAFAFNQGFRGTNLNGYALNIANCSWKYGPESDKDTFTYALLEEQIIFGSRNGVAFVGTKDNFPHTYPVTTYPGDWMPEIVSCVGKTGTNGHSCAAPNGGCAGQFLWGFNLDYVAPGTSSVVTSCTITQYMQTGGWAQFDGTSFAAPHVSGLMSLMMSYWDKPYPDWSNLVHEDCEKIIKRNCTALDSAALGEGPGPDDHSGYGRINAYQALKHINKNYYRIRHFDSNNNIYGATFSTTLAPYTGTIPVYWNNYSGAVGDFTYVPGPIAPGTYSTQIYELTTKVTYSLSPGEKVIDYWPFYKGCKGWGSDTSKANQRTDRSYYTKVDTATKTSATLKTYMWRNVANNTYWPTLSNYIKSAFTLYTYDSTGTAGIKEHIIEANQSNFQVHPNPSYDQFYLTFYTEHYDLLNYQIFDILGREIKRDSFKTEFGKNIIDLSFRGGYGIYILKVFDGKKLLYTQKLIKNE